MEPIFGKSFLAIMLINKDYKMQFLVAAQPLMHYLILGQFVKEIIYILMRESLIKLNKLLNKV